MKLELCDESDNVLLQETWLLDTEVQLLNSLHKDFYAKACPLWTAVQVSQGDDPTVAYAYYGGGLWVPIERLWIKRILESWDLK